MHPVTAKLLAAPPLLSVFIVSAAALAYEVLLIRLFSIIHWHHFAFMVISIALLGYGVSGSFITVFRKSLLSNYQAVFIINIVLFALSCIGCFTVVQQLPFNALEILWDSSQWQRLLLSYLLLTLPFFFVANALALTIMHFHRHIAQVYGFDLIGAGAGALLVMLLLLYFPPDMILRIVAVSGIAAAAFALPGFSLSRKKQTAAGLLLCLLAVAVTPQGWLQPRLSEYKGLEQALLIKDTSLLMRHNSPASQVDVVKSPLVPFRDAPGLSLQSPVGPPEQLAVFRDGDEMTAIDHVRTREDLQYLNYMSSALAYYVRPAIRNVLVLSSATGTQLLQADLHEVAHIDAVEADGQLSRLIDDTYADYFGWQQLQDKVTMHTVSPRGFVASDKQYDLVITGPGGGSTGGAAGVYALSACYDFTLEALQSYLDLLAPEGLLSITMWTSTPARSNLKLFATAVSAMQKNGIKQPENNIAWIRSWNTATLLLKNTALSADEIKQVREFSRGRSFDLAWLPGIRDDEVNRFQLLQEPIFYQAAKAVLGGDGPRFIQQYKYAIEPATDNRPYFNNFFKWSSLPELLALPAKTGISMIGVGYPTLLFTLVQALAAAIVLILLPLLFVKAAANKSACGRWHIINFYLAIGLAFLFIELAFIEKLTLILSQPIYAVAVTLCAFLIFSGLGSLYVEWRMQTQSEDNISRLLTRAVMLIASVAIIYIVMIPLISSTLMAMPAFLRIISAFILVAPLAFFMGMPFPLGMAALQKRSPHLMPWAWGINGCASVLSAVLAVLLAIEVGFNGVVFVAIGLYLLAWLSHTMIMKKP